MLRSLKDRFGGLELEEERRERARKGDGVGKTGMERKETQGWEDRVG